MVTHGILSLYWMPDDAAPETNEDIVDDKIEFGGNAVVPDAKSGMTSVDIELGRRRPKLDNAFEENTIKQDGGFNGTTYTINAIFDETSGTALGIARLRDWVSRSNAVRAKFRHGRIGIRNDHRPEFNLLPNNTAGFKLQNFRINQQGNLAKVDVTIILEFSGNPARLGAA